MLRLLLIITLAGYILYKLGLFRIFLNPQVRGNDHTRHFDRKNYPGGVNGEAGQKAKKTERFKGGEYVDYEEVK